MTPVLQLRAVEKTFAGPPAVNALRNVDLTVKKSDYVSVVGASGSGKSTLLNVVGCLDRPTGGSVHLEGHDVSKLTDGQLAAVRRHHIGFVFQSFHLLAHRTAVENVQLAELYSPRSRAGREQRAVTALRQVGMAHRLWALPSTMSGGERQRVAIARAIVSRPSILLADEPTGNLDSSTSTDILELFDALHRDGLTIIVVTHDMLVAARAQRTVSMVDGVLHEVADATTRT